MKTNYLTSSLILLLFVSNISFSQTRPNLLKKEIKNKIFAIKNVNIIPMTEAGSIIKSATVVIKNDKIETINSIIPDRAITIDGTGKWLMPGLIDMHVHIPSDGGPMGPKIPTQGATLFLETQDYMTLYNANGVTTIFDLNSKPEHFAQRNEIGKGQVIGPRIALSALLDGGKGQGRRVNTPEEGRNAVKFSKAEGYEFIKLYSDLNAETYWAIIEEAQKQGMKTIGHIPDKTFKGKLNEAFVPNFAMVAHAEEMTKHCVDYSEKEAALFAKMLKDNGTWLTPTLTTMEWILLQSRSLDYVKNSPNLQYNHPMLQSKWLTANKYNKNSSPENIALFENFTKFNRLLVKACKAAGVPIVAGTDAGTSGVFPGFSLHDELELLVEAGLTTQEVLYAATNLPSSWLGIERLVGTVEVGKKADLILLDANPLENIKNSREIAGVFINGTWLNKTKIKADLDDLSKRNTAAKGDWDWMKMISGK
jgi:imidazolonepropionase-like amidohydrolase